MFSCAIGSTLYQNRIKDVDKIQEEINQYRPLNDHQTKQLKEYFKIGLTYSSNAIEGNTLTETETKVVIEDGITIGGKPLRDHFEALGHAQAYDHIYQLMKKNLFTKDDILFLHQLFYHKIDSENAGNYRKVQVIISGSDIPFPPASSIPKLMEDFVKNLDKLKHENHPVEFAAIAHNEFINIHPFIDGNGRTARLLVNLILLQNGYEIVIIPPVVRVEYLQACQASNKGDHIPFIHLLSSMLYESQKDTLRLLKELQVK